MYSVLKNQPGAKVFAVWAGMMYSQRTLMGCDCYVALDLKMMTKPTIWGDIHQLPFADNTFYTILIPDGLEHSPEPVHVLNEQKRILTDKGYIFLSTPFLYVQHNAFPDYCRFTESFLKYLPKHRILAKVTHLGINGVPLSI